MTIESLEFSMLVNTYRSGDRIDMQANYEAIVKHVDAQLQQYKEDAERFRLAISKDDNADILHFAVLNNGNDGDTVRKEFDKDAK